MAKTKGPLFSLAASGSLAGTLTMLNQRSGQICKRKSRPTGQPSAAQLAHRERYRAAVSGWHSLTIPEKLAWKIPAYTARITAFNAYISAALLAAPTPQGTQWDGGTTTWDSSSTTWN